MQVDKLIGLVVFLAGVCLLCFTFLLACHLFFNPSGLKRFMDLVGELKEEVYLEAQPFGKVPIVGLGPAVTQLIKLLTYLIPVGLLWVMGSIGARIAEAGVKILKSK